MKIYIQTIAFIFTYITAVYLLFSASFAGAEDLQYSEIDIAYPGYEQPLKLSIWYPAGQCKAASEARFCLTENAKLNQTAILSHGAMGSTRTQNWLGYALASQGIVTVGINHLGESWVYGQENVDVRNVLKIWRRPAHIQFALDALQKNSVDGQPIFNHRANWNNVTAIGFSSGGSTVLSLAGARYDPMMALNYCASSKSEGDLSCSYMPTQDTPPPPPTEAWDSHADTRVKRVVALDPAAGHLTTQASLKSVETPTLIITTTADDFLLHEHHAVYFDTHLVNSELIKLTNNEGHFVFSDPCDHSFESNGIPVCEDRSTTPRAETQKGLYRDLFSFIYRNPRS